MLLKCFKYKTNIPEENLIVNNFMPPKKYLAQEMRLENWISHKHLYQTENAGPIWEVLEIEFFLEIEQNGWFH